jgi:uncharacterized protein (TIGR01777 family)
MDVAITGSHGLIGSALRRSLEGDGHRVRPVVRSGSGDPKEVRWEPGAGTIDGSALEGVDAVVNLAGESIGSGRWSDEQKRAIRESRVRATALLSETLAGLAAKPAVLVSGSAVGYYGDRGDEELSEISGPGDDFLAQVCVDWEAATAMARLAGVRTVTIRSGVVLSGSGGALGAQLRVFKLGLGGRVGDGRQYLSWISLADEVRAIRHLLDDDVEGPVNLTAPVPVTNAEFTNALGQTLGRPTALRIPRLVTRLPAGVGELFRTLLFASQRVHPSVLVDSGFGFEHPELGPALEWALPGK